MTQNSASSIRQTILEKRKQIPVHKLGELSEQVIRHFLNISNLVKLRESQHTVAVYRAFKSELNLDVLEAEFRSWGWCVVFPRIKKGNASMEFVEISNAEESRLKWSLGDYGIQEPHSSLPATPPEAIDLVFVPGVAFGQKGERIGRGKGHYDRTLVHLKKALRIALTFDFQVLPELPQENWDQSVHWVVTENREFRTPFVDHWWKDRVSIQGK